LAAFPPRKTVALRYVDTVSIDGGVSSTGVYEFRANSIFDPDYTSTGHQPMFRDTYSAIYSQYKVNYATITLIACSSKIVNVVAPQTVDGTTIVNQQYYNDGERSCRMFILNSEQANDYPTNFNNMVEEGNTNLKWRFVPQNTSLAMPMLRQRCTPHKLLNCSYNDGGLSAGSGSNPSLEAYFVCGVQDLGGTNPDSMKFQVIITYNVTFFDLIKNQSQN